MKIISKNHRPEKVGEKLLAILEKIKEQEKERGREKTSYREAGDILAKRIEAAGGLKGNQM